MFRMLARRRTQVSVEAGVDKVLFGISLPQDTVVHDIKAEIHIIGVTDHPSSGGTFYGIEMYVLRVTDPDAQETHQITWDQFVPKDTDTQAIDLDTSAQDTTPFFEPGEADWSQVLDIGVRPRKLYGRYKMLTFLNSSFKGRDPATPFNAEFRFGDMVQLRVKRAIRVREPSVLVCGMASPAMDDTSTTEEKALFENEWSRVKYARQMLHQAHMDLIGMTEAGSETPWEDATDLLQKHLEPDVFEQDAASFLSEQFNVFTDAKIDHSVVGDLSVKMLSTGR